MTTVAELNSAVEHLEAAFKQLDLATSGLSGQWQELDAKLNSATSTVEGIHIEMENSLEQLQDRIGSVHEVVSGDIETYRDKLASLGELAVQQFEGMFDDLEEAVDDTKNELVQKFENAWKDAVEELVQDTKEQLVECVEDKATDFSQFAEHFKTSLEKSLEDLGKHITEELARKVAEEGEETVRAAIDRAAHEVIEGIATSQIQIQLTAMLAPFIPPLMIAKVVAGIVNKLLAILRMGT